MTTRIEVMTGAGIRRLIPDVARLRISVFREWPYLYDGDAAYEESYLQAFAECEEAVVVAAIDGEAVVGVATGAPLDAHTEAFLPLFEQAGLDPTSIFYCGESVLLPAWRGRGIGHAFFDHREAHARGLGLFRFSAFCAVIRAPDDQRKPQDYRPLDPFWAKRGYRKAPDMVGNYAWKEIGRSVETDHPMQFWLREIGPER